MILINGLVINGLVIANTANSRKVEDQDWNTDGHY